MEKEKDSTVLFNLLELLSMLMEKRGIKDRSQDNYECILIRLDAIKKDLQGKVNSDILFSFLANIFDSYREIYEMLIPSKE